MDNKTYTYTYSASENEEAKKIKEKYSAQPKPKSEAKLEQLRKLDQGVHLFATMISLTVGIFGTCLFGCGLSMVLVEKCSNFALGIAIGIVGIIILALAKPVYQFTLEKRKKKLAPKIIKLADEILNK